MSPKRMIILHGVAIVGSQQKPISMHVDTGCEQTCMPENTARKLGLSFRRKRGNHYALLADGSKRPMNWEAMLTMRLGPTYACTLKVDISVGTLEPNDMLLGMDWLMSANPKINFRPLSLKITDRNGRPCEIVGMRPPGQPHYCPNHGYRCQDGGRGGSYKIPGEMRTGGGRHGHRSPFGGFGQGIPLFKLETRDVDPPPCTCEEVKDGEKKWIDWRDLFPGRGWYTKSDAKNERYQAAIETLRFPQGEKVGQKKAFRYEAEGPPKPRFMLNTKVTMPLVETKRRHDNYDVFR